MVYQQVSSDKWWQGLQQQEQAKAMPTRLKVEAKTIDEFLDYYAKAAAKHGSTNDEIGIYRQAYADLAQARQYGINEKPMLESFRQDINEGIEHLSLVSNKLNQAKTHLLANMEIINEARQWGYEYDEIEVTKELTSKDEKEAQEHVIAIRNEQLEDYLAKHTAKWDETKYIRRLVKIKPNVIAEQQFLQATYESVKYPNELAQYGKSVELLLAGKVVADNPDKLDQFLAAVELIKAKEMEPEYDLCRQIGSTKDLDVMMSNVNRIIERYQVKIVPAKLAQERENAIDMPAVFTAIQKEQEAFSQIKEKDIIKYYDFDKQLAVNCDLATKQKEEGWLVKLEDVANKAVKAGAYNHESILQDLRQATDLKSCCEQIEAKIEQHHLDSVLNGFNKRQQEAKTVSAVVEVVAERVTYLAKAAKEISDMDKSKQDLLRQGLSHALAKLQDIATQMIAKGIRTEAEIVQELQTITASSGKAEIEGVYVKLDKLMEKEQIKSTIRSNIAAKEKAQNVKEAFIALAGHEKYLASLHGKLKYPEQYAQKFIDRVELAHNNQQQNVLENLYKLARVMQKGQYKTEQEITHIIKSTTDPMATHKELVQHYQQEVIKNIHLSLKSIEDGKIIKVDEKKFDCGVKLMEHIVKTRINEYAPHQEIRRIQAQFIEHHKELALEKDMGIGL